MSPIEFYEYNTNAPDGIVWWVNKKNIFKNSVDIKKMFFYVFFAGLVTISHQKS